MLFLNPQNVAFDALSLDHVVAIAVDRTAHRLALEYSDAGPYPTFVDVPEQKLTLRIVRDLLDADPMLTSALTPGLQANLTFTTAPNASDAAPQTFTVTVVVTALNTDFSRKKTPAQTITAIALSSDGADDPFTPPSGGK